MGKIIIIAEAGVNHNGSFELAKRLIDTAAEAGADYVKFQTFKAEHLVSRMTGLADYQRHNLGLENISQYDMLKKLELTGEQQEELVKYCGKKGIKFLSTAFDMESVDFLATLHLGIWKIPSGEITNRPYLEKIARLGEPIILSTGMSTLEEIGAALEVFEKAGLSRKKVTILHCNTEYPTPYVDVNLRAMETIGRTLGVSVGYSDHTLGIEIPVAATALGARVIEKHFTLDRHLPGPDHRASLEPQELKEMVKAIRHVEEALGDGVKKISPSEAKNREVARKSIVAVCSIKAGEMFTEKNIIVKRPGTGLSPMCWPEVLGQTAKRDFQADELIEL